MSKVKLLLDVTSDLRSLADSVQAVADAMLQNEPTVDTEPTSEAPRTDTEEGNLHGGGQSYSR